MPPPTKPPSVTTYGDNKEWSIVGMSPSEAREYLASFRKTLTFLSIPEPQGWLALKRKNETKLLMHFVHRDLEKAAITSIDAPVLEDQSLHALFDIINDSDCLTVDWGNIPESPRWLLTALYYLK